MFAVYKINYTKQSRVERVVGRMSCGSRRLWVERVVGLESRAECSIGVEGGMQITVFTIVYLVNSVLQRCQRFSGNIFPGYVDVWLMCAISTT